VKEKKKKKTQSYYITKDVHCIYNFAFRISPHIAFRFHILNNICISKIDFIHVICGGAGINSHGKLNVQFELYESTLNSEVKVMLPVYSNNHFVARVLPKV
jgi:hypothetical protein